MPSDKGLKWNTYSAPETMQLLVLLFLLLFCITPISGSTSEFGNSLQADVLYIGEHIITLDDELGKVTAVAVKGEDILWVGASEDWRGRASRIVELGDRALIPGMIDAHGHLSFMSLWVDWVNLAPPPAGQVDSIASLQNQVRRHVQEKDIAAGEWVVGMGYDDSLMEEGRHPTRHDLDAISTEHPIALLHASGHLTATNSLALELAGISADTPNPPGGVIRREAGSNVPNGVLEEKATAAVRHATLGKKSSAQNIEKALQYYARYGVTTVQDGGASWKLHQQLSQLDLDLDVILYVAAMKPDFEIPTDTPVGSYHDRLKVGGVKLLLDGSLQGKTAYLSEPYKVVPHGQSQGYRGYPRITQSQVNDLVTRFLSWKVQMHVHSNGDAAAQMLIDALDKAATEQPLDDHRTVLIHAQVVREDQLDRMQGLGMMPSFFSAHTYFWGDWHRDSVLGIERASRISPTHSALQRGMPFTVHNDSPIIPPDMMRLLWATTNRITRSGEVLGAEQRISTLDALKAVTVHAAYQHFEESVKGSITPGKQADLVILSQNPLDVATGELMSVEIVETVARGRSVYRRD